MFVKRSLFNLSHDVKLDVKMGPLYPVLVEEVLPGDTFRCRTDLLVRALPLVGPVYHDIDVLIRYFFVPNRLTWSNWETFITHGPQGNASNIPPYFSNLQVTKGSIFDFFGAPIVNTTDSIDWITALEARAYSQIINDWFIDQTLMTPRVIAKTDGIDATSDTSLFNVCWEKDYFTACLPSPQRGNPVTISIGTSAPVIIPGSTATPANDQLAVNVYNSGGAYNTFAVDPATGEVLPISSPQTIPDPALQLRGQSASDNSLVGTADLTNATAITINDLRLATQIQRFLERMARTGARYVEYIMGMFGVRSADARLQRAEYLGGGRTKIIISEVIQTSETNTTPQGHLAGHGFALMRSNQFKKSFTEHGYIMGLMYILPKTSYRQGLPRRMFRKTVWDYFVPLFAHLGEQAVLKKELYYSNSEAGNEDPFGYIGRWDELRRRENRVCNDFRNDTGLGNWCLTRVFSARPSLEATFVQSDPAPRIFADTDGSQFAVFLKHNIKAIRPLPKIGEPGFMDH